MIYPLEDLFELFFAGEIAVVEQDGIVGPAEGAFLPVGIDVIAHFEVVLYLVEGDVGIGRGHFLKAADDADGGVGRHEDFQFGVGEYDGADVAAIHDKSAMAAHGLLLTYGSVAHFLDRGYLAYFFGHKHLPDEVGDVFAVEVDIAGAGCRIPVEGQFQASEGFSNFFFIIAIDAVAQEVQGDGAVHGAAVDIVVVQDFCELASEGAFAAGGITVDSYNNLWARHGAKVSLRQCGNVEMRECGNDLQIGTCAE